MDNRPIGIFDSGLGGLTAAKRLISRLPNENTIYFGDTGRIPYGTRSRETIIKYTREAVSFLLTKDVKLILIACGTATTVLDSLGDYGLPILGVAYSAAKKAVLSTRSKKIGLIATTASVRSGLYQRHIASLDPDCEVYAEACPLLVHMVENGRINVGDRVCEMLVSEYLAPIKAKGIDTLILGCTHYPMLSGIIANEIGRDVVLIDPGAEVVETAYSALCENDALNGDGNPGAHSFYVSDSADNFASLGSMFLGSRIDKYTEIVDISAYGNGIGKQ